MCVGGGSTTPWYHSRHSNHWSLRRDRTSKPESTRAQNTTASSLTFPGLPRLVNACAAVRTRGAWPLFSRHFVLPHNKCRTTFDYVSDSVWSLPKCGVLNIMQVMLEVSHESNTVTADSALTMIRGNVSGKLVQFGSLTWSLVVFCIRDIFEKIPRLQKDDQ